MKIPIYELRNDKDRQTYLFEVNSFEADCTLFQQPSQIVKFLKDGFQMEQLATERVYAVYFKYMSQVAGIMLIAQGGYNAAYFSPREVLVCGLLLDAHNFVMVHNHPSGKVVPSTYDREITQKMQEAGEIVGLQLMDHLIIGKDYFSFVESGLLI